MDHAFQKFIVAWRKQTVKLQQNSKFMSMMLPSLPRTFWFSCLTAFLSFRYQLKCRLSWPPSPKHTSRLHIHCHSFSQCSLRFWNYQSKCVIISLLSVPLSFCLLPLDTGCIYCLSHFIFSDWSKPPYSILGEFSDISYLNFLSAHELPWKICRS